jgi:dihydroorotase
MVHGLRTDEAKWPGGIPLAELFNRLKGGDVATHCFCQYKSFVAWDAAAEARQAVERGVVLDVGHGTGSFSFDVASQAIELGLPPTTISTDIHHMNYCGPVYDLVTTMSKFLLLGMSLDDVVAKSTIAPANIIGKGATLGTLKVGAAADAVILDVQSGEFTFEDSYGNARIGNAKLVPVAVIRDGILQLGGTWTTAGGVAPGPLYRPEVLGKGLEQV